MRVSAKTVTITHDLIPGHTYEVMVAAVDSTGRIQKEEDSPKDVVTIRGKTTSPGAGSALTAVGGILSIVLSWTNPVDYDFHHMNIYRSSTILFEDAALIDSVSGNVYIDELGSTNLTRYYWIEAVNTSGKTSDMYPESTSTGVSATTSGVVATDIDDFAITASKTFLNTVILTSDTWSNNTPGAGSVAWNAHNLTYGGAYYLVAAGNTASRYVTWTVGNTSGSGTVADPYLTTYSGDATYTSANNKFNIAVNESGTNQLVWNSSANMVIGSAFILDAAIVEAKIDNLAVTAAKIALATITDAQIASLNVDKVTAGTLLARPVQSSASGSRVEIFPSATIGLRIWDDAANVTLVAYVGGGLAGDFELGDYFGSDSGVYYDASGGTFNVRGLLVADDIVANGTITSNTFQTAAANERLVLSRVDNTMKFYNAAGHVVLVIDDNIYDGEPGMLAGNTVETIDGILAASDGVDYSYMKSTEIKTSGNLLYLGILQGGNIELLNGASIEITGSTLTLTNAPGTIQAAGTIQALGGFIDGVAGTGVDGTFKDFDENVITVSGGIITDLTT